MGKNSKRRSKSKKDAGNKGQQKQAEPSSSSSSRAVATVDNDLDAKCKRRLVELSLGALKNKNTPLRFGVGDRVKCSFFTEDVDVNLDRLSITDLIKMSMTNAGPFVKWSHGVVTQLWYCESGSSEYHPYQICLDDDTLIYAPHDDDRSIQKSNIPLPAVDPREVAIFKQPPPTEDCPICFIPLPVLYEESAYFNCCGKVICSECRHASDKASGAFAPCSFCRTEQCRSYAELVERLRRRVEAGDSKAMFELGDDYMSGSHVTQDKVKGFELISRAADLGSPMAHCRLGFMYKNGDGVRVDLQKARYHFEKAAIEGHLGVHYELGFWEWELGNTRRAMKHFISGAMAGDEKSLHDVKEGFMCEVITKDEYIQTLRAYEDYVGDTKSKHRDEAIAQRSFD